MLQNRSKATYQRVSCSSLLLRVDCWGSYIFFSSADTRVSICRSQFFYVSESAFTSPTLPLRPGYELFSTILYIYIYIYIYIYMYIIMSRCLQGYPWPSIVSIIHCSREVFKATSTIATDLLYIDSNWSSCFCSSMGRGPQEYVANEFFLTLPAVAYMSGSSNLDCFRDGWLVAV